MVQTTRWRDEDFRFLEAVANLLARGWRPPKFSHYQSLAASLQAMETDYEDEDVERYCQRLFRMDSQGYIRRKDIDAHFKARTKTATDRPVGAEGHGIKHLPLDDTGIDSEAPPADWIRNIEDSFAQAAGDIQPYPTPTSKGSHPQEDIVISPDNPDHRPSKKLRVKPRFWHWIPILLVALALWLVLLHFLGGLVSGMAGAPIKYRRTRRKTDRRETS